MGICWRPFRIWVQRLGVGGGSGIGFKGLGFRIVILRSELPPMISHVVPHMIILHNLYASKPFSSC